MGTHDQQLDSIYLALGPRGRFIKLQLFLLWIACIPAGYQLLSNVFIGPQVPHRCARPRNESTFIETYRDMTNFQNITVSYAQCEIHILIDDTVVEKETCIFGMEYDLPVDSSFVAQFDLVCDSTNLARLTQTLVIGGQAFGALLAALFADRLGRKPVLVGSHIGLILSGIGIAYSTNYVMLSTFKFIVGGFQQASLTVIVNIMVELMRTNDRRIAAALGGLYWASGVILLDVIAYILRDQTWRTVQMAISLGTIPAFLEIFLMKESLRWLLANGKTKQASDYITTAATMNGKTQEEILQALELIIARDTVDEDKSTPKNQQKEKLDDKYEVESFTKMTYLDIFRHPRLLLNTVILWIGWFTVAFGFFAIYLGSTALAGNRFLNFLLTALMEIPSNIYFYFGMNRHGRKKVLICMFSFLSVGLIASGTFSSFESTNLHAGLSIAFNMVAMAGASGGFGILFFYTPELFPTNIRNQALGMSSMMARIGGMLAPFTAILSDQAKWGPGALIGCLACLVAVLVRFLPETNGRELPQTLEDLQMWFDKDNKINTDDGGAGGLMMNNNEKSVKPAKNGANSVI